MADLLHDPAHWRDLAQHHRQMAEESTDPEAKRSFSDIANSYEDLAQRAEARIAEKR